jgi:16S rRNA (guanine966-N2)-methyltransferase
VRIIGGRWRGSLLPVADVAGLRPSSDRVRETLFNWLQFELAGRRVLDLFAGTGALGLEALSRGAARALLVESDPVAARELRASCERLGAGTAQVLQADARRWLRTAEGEFDLVFLDPPFADGDWTGLFELLAPRLAAGALVYVEAARGGRPAVPADWRLQRQGQTREVDFALYRRGDGGDTLGAGDP